MDQQPKERPPRMIYGEASKERTRFMFLLSELERRAERDKERQAQPVYPSRP